jgi:hypothetical protein
MAGRQNAVGAAVYARGELNRHHAGAAQTQMAEMRYTREKFILETLNLWRGFW